MLRGKSIGVRADTTAADWLANGPLAQVGGYSITPIDDHFAGVAAVANRAIAAYFADRAILRGVLKGGTDGADLVVSKVSYTNEAHALALPRDDEDLRLLVDRALSHLYRNGAILKIYREHLGKPTTEVALFYAMVAMQE